MDPGGQRRQGHDRAVFRAQEPLHPHRRPGRCQGGVTVRGRMRIEYFHIIARIIALDIVAKSIRTEAIVPTTSTIFEGHFPGYPLMPGVLLCEAMAQTSGWLIIALTRFDRMPFLASLKDVKLRTFVSPGEKLNLSAKILHDGSGFAITTAECAVGEK